MVELLLSRFMILYINLIYLMMRRFF